MNPLILSDRTVRPGALALAAARLRWTGDAMLVAGAIAAATLAAMVLYVMAGRLSRRGEQS
jgi:hypothetical protein